MKIREVHQIEITSRCNLACKYCPHPKLEREKMDMDDDTFTKSMAFIHKLYMKGTQTELSFTGLGEATLHPKFGEMLKIARKCFPDIDIVFSTNGLPSFKEELAYVCQQNNVGVFISLHRPEVAARTVELCRDYGILKQVNMSAATQSFDWAGQMDWIVSAPNIVCDYLKRGWGVILVDGSLATCCIDAHGVKRLGTVDQEPDEIEIAPFKLCESCHMQVPENT